MSGAVVMEHSSSHTVVGALTAIDPDAGAVLNYALKLANEAGSNII